MWQGLLVTRSVYGQGWGGDSQRTAAHARASKSRTVGTAQFLGRGKRKKQVWKKWWELLAVKEKHGHCQPTERGELQNKYLTFSRPASPSCPDQRKRRRHLHTVTFHCNGAQCVLQTAGPRSNSPVPGNTRKHNSHSFRLFASVYWNRVSLSNSGWFQTGFSLLRLLSTQITGVCLTLPQGSHSLHCFPLCVCLCSGGFKSTSCVPGAPGD